MQDRTWAEKFVMAWECSHSVREVAERMSIQAHDVGMVVNYFVVKGVKLKAMKSVDYLQYRIWLN